MSNYYAQGHENVMHSKLETQLLSSGSLESKVEFGQITNNCNILRTVTGKQRVDGQVFQKEPVTQMWVLGRLPGEVAFPLILLHLFSYTMYE